MKLRPPLPAMVSFWLCAAPILVLSLVPPAPELPTTGWDKSNHLLGFAVLALLGRAAYARHAAAMFIGVLLYGGLIEALQAMTPYRSPEWADWLADALGVALAEAIRRLYRYTGGMALNARLGVFAGVWGLAEATAFFIVPDVLLSATALRRRRLALMACAWATAGALVGGTAMYLWGRADAAGAAAFLDRIPAIGPTMLKVVRASLDEHGLAALFLGPLTGTPYKLYAVAAGQAGAAFLPFLLVSLPARAIRFVLIVLLTDAIARRLPAGWGPPILAVSWLAFYAAYFAHMGW